MPTLWTSCFFFLYMSTVFCGFYRILFFDFNRLTIGISKIAYAKADYYLSSSLVLGRYT